jgi:hypothetical protein
MPSSPSAEQTGRTAVSTYQSSAAPVTDAQQAFAELGRVDLGQESMETVLRSPRPPNAPTGSFGRSPSR